MNWEQIGALDNPKGGLAYMNGYALVLYRRTNGWEWCIKPGIGHPGEWEPIATGTKRYLTFEEAAQACESYCARALPCKVWQSWHGFIKFGYAKVNAATLR